MTTSNHRKMLKQLKVKPAKLKKFLKHCGKKERKEGKSSNPCVRCGRFGAHIGSYDLNLCRQCFREIATKIGFKKYN
jgi:small subunit ribosomal protein S14